MMKTQILVLMIIASFLFSCEENGLLEDDLQVEAVSVVTSEIDAEDLPTAALDFIDTKFSGELVIQAFAVKIPNEPLMYDVNLTNAVSLTFDEAGSLALFGEALVGCDGRMKKGEKRGRRGRGRGNKPDSSTHIGQHEILEFDELPEAAQTYMTSNYPDDEILKILSKEDSLGLPKYKVLVAEVGAIVFDADGEFVALNDRGGRGCAAFDELAVADLPEAIVSYISENYPDAEVKKARIGTIKEETRIHVFLVEVGVLIFDGEGVFLKLHTRRK
ncbi:MAG: PepSY-like domain-containing protein [Cyclobacteriaceae bacterium]